MLCAMPDTQTLTCPQCGSAQWQAIEVMHSVTPCTLISTPDGEVEINFDARAELSREASTSAVMHYMCADEDCAYHVQPTQLSRLTA
jgi:hypothetical protein